MAQLGVLVSTVLPSTLQASETVSSLAGKKVSSIRVEGVRRIDAEAVLIKIKTKEGEPLSRETLRNDIQAIYSLGYFDEISVEGSPKSDGGVDVLIRLKERPAIAKIEFDGNEQISTSDLEEVIKVKPWTILDTAKVRQDVELLQKHYEEKGYYLSKIDSSIRPVKENGKIKDDEVVLVYKVQDFDKVQIKKITFLNNKAFSDERLKGILGETREGNVLSFISGSGSFKESAFKQDLQRLTYWYLENGYVKFKFENPVVTVSEDRRWVYITLYVDEGEQYKMGTLDFSGDLLFTKEELAELLTLRESDTFSISKRNQDIQSLSEKVQDLGYAFVNVIPKMNVKDETKTVDIDYSFEKGNLVYFGEINVVGNTKTWDRVIRRELRIQEGELFSGTKLRISRENVERLGFFMPGEVVFNQMASKDNPDVMNIEIGIKERSTGTITLGAGYGSAQGFFFTTQISEINLFGRGQSLSLAGQYAGAAATSSFNLGFTDPYAFGTRWSLGGDLFYVRFPIPGKYTTTKTGAAARGGYLIAEYVNTFFTYKVENMFDAIAASTVFDPDPRDVEADLGILSGVVFSIIRDKRNNRFETTAGNYQSASVEFAGLGGDKYFFKMGLNNRYYRKLIGEFVLRNSVEFGYLTPWNNDALPPSERYYLGGPNNLKGYDFFSVGPKRDRGVDSTGRAILEPVGGTLQAFGLLEVEHPLIREAGLKLVTFFDIGSTIDLNPADDVLNPGLKADAGFGLRWFSPIGPLRFEWGYPLRPLPGESPSVFQFFIGPPF
jgi:outer membrane protein insertion porin family